MIHYIITGGRDYENEYNINAFLHGCKAMQDNWNQQIHISMGDCKTGVDAIARKICNELNIPYTVYLANWHKYGRGAGPIRNHKMIDTCLENIDPKKDAVIVGAFAGGRGTADCVRYAEKKGCQIIKLDERIKKCLESLDGQQLSLF